jgi:hypothetical protein
MAAPRIATGASASRPSAMSSTPRPVARPRGEVAPSAGEIGFVVFIEDSLACG